MKSLLLILSLLLSLFTGGKEKADAAAVAASETTFRVAEATSSGTEAGYFPNRDLCITAAQGLCFAGNGGSNSVSARTSHSGRRISPQTRLSFRVIKSGKVIDYNRTHPFLTPVFVPLSGTHVPDRYLFSICRLRL